MYRKFTADYIFTGSELLPEHNVLITDSNGEIIEIVSAAEAGDDIEHLHGILSPGFINTHCHLELSHLKNKIPRNTGLIDFVYKVITERNFNEAEILGAIQEAENEMQQNGIVAVGDICNTSNTITQKKQQNLHYHNFIEVTGFVPAAASKRFEETIQVLNKFGVAANKRSSITPHAPYSVSPQLFEHINNKAGNSLISIHNQETPEEDEFFKTGTGDFLTLYKKLGIDISFFKPTGKSSLHSILPFFNKLQSLILVHDVTTSDKDLDIVSQAIANRHLSNVFLCLCPNANLYISNTLPQIDALVNSGLPIVLGTDSLASNNQLSILEEIKTLQNSFSQLTLPQLLQWATLNGAKALQMNDTLGSFEKGKKPGIVLIEGVNNLQLQPNTAARRIL